MSMDHAARRQFRAEQPVGFGFNLEAAPVNIKFGKVAGARRQREEKCESARQQPGLTLRVVQTPSAVSAAEAGAGTSAAALAAVAAPRTPSPEPRRSVFDGPPQSPQTGSPTWLADGLTTAQKMREDAAAGAEAERVAAAVGDRAAWSGEGGEPARRPGAYVELYNGVEVRVPVEITAALDASSASFSTERAVGDADAGLRPDTAPGKQNWRGAAELSDATLMLALSPPKTLQLKTRKTFLVKNSWREENSASDFKLEHRTMDLAVSLTHKQDPPRRSKFTANNPQVEQRASVMNLDMKF